MYGLLLRILTAFLLRFADMMQSGPLGFDTVGVLLCDSELVIIFNT